MRFPGPIILGAGPAGCAAAIAVMRKGGQALLVDRDETVGDALCGGFLSWKTAEQLRSLDLDCSDLGAHHVHTLRLFARAASASVPLPQVSYGLSRHALDSAMRAEAIKAGAEFEVDTIRRVAGQDVFGTNRQYQGEALFLANGKHDIRGMSRPRRDADPTLGLRLKLAATPELRQLLDGAIELHLFKSGYAGIVLQENGCANICLAVRKSLLAKAGGFTHDLLEILAEESASFAQRLTGILANNLADSKIDTIGAVPYGWVAQSSDPGIFRLGDQAAVIPSLVGEGISIALASGISAAQYWRCDGQKAAPQFQKDFARNAAQPIRLANMARRIAESEAGHHIALATARIAPSMIIHLMERTRLTLGHAD